MADTNKIPSFMIALRNVTMIPGEGLPQFREQYKALTELDKQELHEMLTQAGIAHSAPAQQSV